MLELNRSFQFAFFCLTFAFLLPSVKGQLVVPEKDGEKVDELKRRKEIAEVYLSTLDKVKESWIDPYEMISCQTPGCADMIKKKDQTVSSVDEDVSCDVAGSKFDDLLPDTDKVAHQILNEPLVNDKAQLSTPASIYFSRWIKKLLLFTEKENIDESNLISFSMNEGVLNHLKELSHYEKLEISQVDELFTNLLAEAIISERKIYDWTDMLDYTKYIVWAIAGGSVTIFFLYLFYISSRNHPYLTCFCIFLTIAVFWHWMHLFQQRVASKQAELSSMNIPNECRKHDFGFFEHIQEYFKSFFKSNGCVKYHEALSVDPIWEVSITVAISEAFTAFLLQPLSTASRILNKSLKHLFDELPLEIKVFMILFILLMLIMMCNYRIRLPYFMAVIEPVHPVGSSVQNVEPPKSLTESSKEKAVTVINYIQGKNPTEHVEPEMLTHSPKESSKVRQSSEPVQIFLKPKKFFSCSNCCDVEVVKSTESVKKIKNAEEIKTSSSDNISSETDVVQSNQPADSASCLSVLSL